MVRFGSPQWVEQLDRVAAGHPGLAAATVDTHLVIGQDVTDGPQGHLAWHVVLHNGSVRVHPGQAPDAHVTFRQDHATAVAIARGELSAQTAFMVGRLRVSGDVSTLIEQQDALAGLDDIFAAVRADTEF